MRQCTPPRRMRTRATCIWMHPLSPARREPRCLFLEPTATKICSSWTVLTRCAQPGSGIGARGTQGWLQICEEAVAVGIEASQSTGQEFTVLGFCLCKVHARPRRRDPGVHPNGTKHAKSPRVCRCPSLIVEKVCAVPLGVCAQWPRIPGRRAPQWRRRGRTSPRGHVRGHFRRLSNRNHRCRTMGETKESFFEKFGAVPMLLSWAAETDLPSHQRKLF